MNLKTWTQAKSSYSGANINDLTNDMYNGIYLCILFADERHLQKNSFSGAGLGFSEGRGPNFRKGANQYKTKKKQI